MVLSVEIQDALYNINKDLDNLLAVLPEGDAKYLKRLRDFERDTRNALNSIEIDFDSDNDLAENSDPHEWPDLQEDIKKTHCAFFNVTIR